MKIVALAADERTRLLRLLDERDVGDALACYYALHHAASRVQLSGALSPEGGLLGFLARAQTGQDLFRPLVTGRAPDFPTLTALVQAALAPGQPLYISLPMVNASWARALVDWATQTRLRLYVLRRESFSPVVNILVTRSTSPDGLPRYEIRLGERLLAAAGLNWRSPAFAEVFVHTDPALRERGHGRSVVAALCQELLEAGCTPLYAADETSPASQRLAESVGFSDSGQREFVCTGTLRPPAMAALTSPQTQGAADG
ncbi:MAG: GNAT family N-acetyltransferase [Chloroflexi bacterium]|nr:GNAT family N-acetyltransferase [Chloroflexota bacterium]